MKKTKILAVLLSVLLCAASLAACGDTNENNTQNPGSQSSGNNSTETATLGLSSYDWKYEDDEVMFTVGDIPVTFEDYRYYAMYNKSYFDYGDDSYWTDVTNSEYKQLIVDEFKQMYGIKALCNNELGITYDEQDATILEANISELKGYYGDEFFASQLDSMFLTEEHFRKLSEFDYLNEKLYRSFVTDEEMLEYAKENYVCVQHVLIKTVDDTNAELPENEQAEKKALADEIYKKAIDGEDFYSLVEQYGEDPGMENNPAGYTFTYGYMIEEFEEASFALEVGGISEPVKTSYGYHIIKKLPLDEEYFLNRANPEYIDIIYTLGSEEATAAINEYLESVEVVETDKFNELTMGNIGEIKK